MTASGDDGHDGIALHTKLDELSNQLTAMVNRQTDATGAPDVGQPAPATPAPEITSASVPADPSSGLSAKSLIERIEQSERTSSDSMNALNAKLSDLGNRLQSLQEEKAAPPAPADPKPEIDSAIKKVLSQVEEAEKRNRDLMKSLQDRMAEIGARAASAPEVPASQSAPAIQALEQRLADLHEKLDQKERQTKEDPRLKSLEKKLAELSEGLEALPSGHGMTPQNGEAGDAAQYLAGRMAAGELPINAASRDDLTAVERRMDELAQQMSEAIARPSNTGADAERMRNDLAAVSEQVRQIKASAASNRDVQSMRASLENLTKLVSQRDDTYPLDGLHQRINELAHVLQTSLPSAAERNKVSDLEAKILQLDARLSAAQAQPDNTVALRALEEQVKQVAVRLGEHEKRLSSLAQIESSIAQLTGQLENTSNTVNHSTQKTAQLEASVAQLTSRLQVTRNEASSSAETAAQRMAEQLRLEVEAKTAQQAVNQVPATELAALQQGLQAIQTHAQTTDRKTQDTLVAVHDTLDSVIERMNQIEAAKAAVAASQGLSPSQAAGPVTTPGPVPSSAAISSAPGHPAQNNQAPAAGHEQMAAPVHPGEFAAPNLPTGPGPNNNPGPAGTAAMGTLAPAAGQASLRGEAGPSGSRQDFIAAAREAARAAGHTQAEQSRAGATAQTPAMKLGPVSKGAQPGDGAGQKQGKNKLILAGAMALLIGAATGYGVLNFSSNPSGLENPVGNKLSAPSGTQKAPAASPATNLPSSLQPAETAPLDGSAPASGGTPSAGSETGGGGVQPAESVPFDPTAPAQSSSLQGGAALPADPIQTGSASNRSNKSGKSSGSMGFVPSSKQLDPNVTAIGKTAQSGSGATIEALTQLSNGSAPATVAQTDPFVTGSVPNAATASVESQNDTRSASEIIESAGLPSELGPEGMLAAAVKGDKVAQFMVAARYSDGKAVPKDFDKAAKWYHKAASKGLAPAQYRLGTLYERGRGVQKDVKTARSWYEHAAHRGHIKAMHNIAVLLANGMDGQPNFSQAVYWFKKAANFGLKDSQYNLAILHQQGLGVPKDEAEAYRWYALAAKQKDKDAAKRLKLLAAKMDPQKLQKAKQLVETWRPVRAKFAANVVTPPIGGWQSAQNSGSPSKPLALSPLPADAVKQAQRLLNAIGFDAGVADGKMGPQTAKAIRTFQQQEGMPVTGKVSSALLQKLRNVPG